MMYLLAMYTSICDTKYLMVTCPLSPLRMVSGRASSLLHTLSIINGFTEQTLYPALLH